MPADIVVLESLPLLCLGSFAGLDEQRRIADILDKFEALTTSLQDGLPAEIAARRKQYEHYREQLLSFKRKEK